MEPSFNKRWSMTADAMRAEFDSARPDGTKVDIIRLSSRKYRIIRKKIRDDDVRVHKTNILIFDPTDEDGPFLMENPSNDIDVLAFVREKFDHTLTHIETDEARKYIVELLNRYCFGALFSQKGGTYYVDIQHIKILRRLSKLMLALGNTLGIFPVPKIENNSDINYIPMLRDIIAYQMERRFKLNTLNIKRMMTKQLSNKLVGKYIGVIKESLREIKYYAEKFDLHTQYKTIRKEAKEMINILDTMITMNLKTFEV
jgi:hypothetical protein